MTTAQKDYIDNMSYYDLLKIWRFDESGCPLFQGNTGSYYQKVMHEKRAELSHETQVSISKRIGWVKS